MSRFALTAVCFFLLILPPKPCSMWDLTTGECRSTLEGHMSGVNTVAISLDGMSIVSGSGERDDALM